MKTKFIWTAMCLPLAFAACTNEEVFVEDNLAVLEGKKAVELKVAATYGAEGAESRMVNNNGTFLWDNTDVLGAVWNKDGGIYSNNRFTNSLTQASAQADFTTQATTVEGSYVFYYPYNTDVTKDLNSGIVYSLPEPQEYDPTGQKMMDNNFMISPNVKVDGNEPGELTLPLTLRSIYAYGVINLTLPEVLVVNGSNVNSVDIQKIIISYNSNVYKAGKINIDNVPVVDLTADYIKSLIDGTKTSATDLEKSCKGKTEAEVRAILFAAADKKLTAQADNYADGDILGLTSGDTSIQQVSISCVSAEHPNGITLTKNSTFSTRVLLPTTAEAGAEVTVKVYTNQGMCRVLGTVSQGVETGVQARIKANHTANLANLNRDGDETSFMMTSFEPIGGEIYAVSEADFIASIKQFKNTTIKAHIGDFSLTPAAIAAIPSTVKVDFETAVTFEGDMILKNVIFAAGEKATFKSGNIVIESIAATETGTTTYEIKKDAKVTMKPYTTSVVSARPTIVVDGGKLIYESYDKDGEPVAQDKAAYSLEVKNNGIVDVKTPAKFGEFTLAKGTLENAAEISGTVKVAADGIVNNNGTITVTNAGTVNNYGVLNGTNTNTVNQMSEDAKATLSENSGSVYTIAYSETTVTTNTGDIYFAANARVSANGNVTYQAPADIKATDFSQLPTAITKIEFANDFTYDYVHTTSTDESELAELQDNVKTLVFKGNLTLSQDWALNTSSTIQFIGAKADVKGGKTLSNAVTILAGVQDSDPNTTGDQKISTKVYIGTNTTIKTVSTVTLSGDATVWNDGNVYGNASTTNAWGGNVIKPDPVQQ